MAAVAASPIRFSLLGHKARCFDVRFQGNLLLSASEDGTCKLWDASTRRCLFTFIHNNKDTEVLRASFVGPSGSLVCTCGANGEAILWSKMEGVSSSSSSWSYEQRGSMSHGEEQIYVSESVQNLATGNVELLTAADDRLYLWDLSAEQVVLRRSWSFVGSTQRKRRDGEEDDGEEDEGGREGEMAFGGPRNPEQKAYIFDAKPAPISTHKIAIALSDGTVRVLDTRLASSGTEHVIDLSTSVHATSVTWSSDEGFLLVSFGNGSVSILDVVQDFACVARLQAHESSCFGTAFLEISCASSSTSSTTAVPRARFISWSSDCSVKEWDLTIGDQGPPTPVRSITLNAFPIYACAIDEHGSIACGGGGGGSTTVFMGVPVHFL